MAFTWVNFRFNQTRLLLVVTTPTVTLAPLDVCKILSFLSQSLFEYIILRTKDSQFCFRFLSNMIHLANVIFNDQTTDDNIPNIFTKDYMGFTAFHVLICNPYANPKCLSELPLHTIQSYREQAILILVQLHWIYSLITTEISKIVLLSMI